MTGTKILLLALLLFPKTGAVAAVEQHSSFNRVVSGGLVASRSLASDCHCDGDHVHCNEQESEALCHCDDGEVHCEVAHDCHCDGDHAHCSKADSEGFCHCDGGEVHCEHHADDTSEKVDQKVDQQAVQEDDGKPWAEVIVASLIVNLVTLIGVVIVAGEFVRKIVCPKMQMDLESQRDVVKNYIPMFACGALMAMVFLLVLPEALHLIESGLIPESDVDDHSGHNHRNLEGDKEEYKESMATWMWGVSVMAGFMIPAVIHALLSHSHDEEVVYSSTGSMMAESNRTTDEENIEVTKQKEQETHEVTQELVNKKSEEESPAKNLDSKTKKIDWALFASLAIGDFFSQLCRWNFHWNRILALPERRCGDHRGRNNRSRGAPRDRGLLLNGSRM